MRDPAQARPARRHARLLAVVVAATLASSPAAGCGSDDEPDTGKGSSADDAFVAEVRPDLSKARSDSLSDTELVRLAKYACRNMDNGYTYDLTQSDVESRGNLSPAEADHLLQAATARYCPQYEPDKGP